MITNPIHPSYYHPNFTYKDSEVADGIPKIAQSFKPTLAHGGNTFKDVRGLPGWMEIWKQ